MSPAIPLPPLPPEVAASTVRAWLEKGTGRVYGGLGETALVSVEQRRVGDARGRRPQAEKTPGRRSGDPAAGRAGQQPRADEERLGDRPGPLRGPRPPHPPRWPPPRAPRRPGATARGERRGRADRAPARRPRRPRAQL